MYFKVDLNAKRFEELIEDLKRNSIEEAQLRKVVELLLKKFSEEFFSYYTDITTKGLPEDNLKVVNDMIKNHKPLS